MFERILLKKNFFSISCLYCEKSFKDNDTLQVHISFVHRDIISNCLIENCENSFENDMKKPKNLKEHVNSSFKFYNCKTCEKTFKNTSDLQRHRRLVHMKERLFECSFCGKCFQTGANARRHFYKVCGVKN